MIAPTPLDYASWRRTRLGSITEAVEARAVLAAIGEVENRSVLDVGCGDGACAAALARPGATVIGLDRSVPALSAARARGGEASAAPAFCAGDAAQLPFRDASFDLVVAVASFTFVASPPEAAREVARVLRPGGRAVLGELGRWSWWATWRRIRRRAAGSVWREKAFWTPAALRRLLAGAGLVPGRVRGAVFYPPFGLAAVALAPIDGLLARVSSAGAAFLVVEAVKPTASRPHPR